MTTHRRASSSPWRNLGGGGQEKVEVRLFFPVEYEEEEEEEDLQVDSSGR